MPTTTATAYAHDYGHGLRPQLWLRPTPYAMTPHMGLTALPSAQPSTLATAQPTPHAVMSQA